MKKTLLALLMLIFVCGSANAADWGMNFNFNHPNLYVYPPVAPVPPSGYYYYPAPVYPAYPFSFYYREKDKRPRDRGRDCRPQPRHRDRNCR